MIELTRFNGGPFTLNAQWIETVEAVPDTVITLTTGRKYVVREGPDEVRTRCVEFFRACGGAGGAGPHPGRLRSAGAGGAAALDSADKLSR